MSYTVPKIGFMYSQKLNCAPGLAPNSYIYVSVIYILPGSLVARRLAVRQARVRFSARHHREVPPLSKQAMKKWREASANGDGWMWLYECMCVCYKKWKINKKSGIMPPNIYILPGSVSLFGCSKIGRPTLGIYKSLTDTWMWKLGDRTEHYNFILEITRPCNFISGNT